MKGKTILVVEDDNDIRDLISYHLSKNGYDAVCVPTAEQALLAIGTKKPDLILLDLMLPGIDGMSLFKHVKMNDAYKDIPVIMVTAKTEEEDIVQGLECGANDYITKPFSPQILIARIKTVLRNKKEEFIQEQIEQEPILIHDLYIDPKRHKITIKNQPIDLTITEFRILYFFASNPGWVFNRGQIVEKIHGNSYYVTDRSIDVLIFSLRKKLKEYGAYIETVRGVGYRFKDQ